MPRRIRFLPECHADTALIGFLLNDDETLYRHSQGSEVAKDMKAAADSGDFDRVVGIVDGDKTSKPRYFDSFELMFEKDNVQLHKKSGAEEYLLVIVGKKVGIETFLLTNAEHVGVNFQDYGFDTAMKELKPRFKSVNIETDPNYRQLLTDLHALNAPGLITLQTLLHDLFHA
jgi:hypothetical protein